MTDFEKFSALFRYDPETGELFWRKFKAGRQQGKPAGHRAKDGYRRIMLDYKMYVAHRIVWLLHHGNWPENHIDHIDRNPSNNRIENLRDVTRGVNVRNAKAKKDNVLGDRGISALPNGRYSVRLQGLYLGSFNSLIIARKVRNNYNATHD